MDKYIFRGDRSGVFFGELGQQDGQKVEIKNCRRLWRWDGACSLSELALSGTQKKDGCKFTVIVDVIEIYDLIEKIKCTEKAIKSIEGVKNWKY